MENNKFILFYDKCRLCLDKPGVSDICETEDLPRDIYLFIGVKVTSKDNLPQKICAECREVVVNAKELRLVATRNDSHLRSLFDDDDETYGVVTLCVSHITKSLNTSKTTYEEDSINSVQNKRSLKKRKMKSLDTVTSQAASISVRTDLLEIVSSSTKVKIKNPKIRMNDSPRVRSSTEVKITEPVLRNKMDTKSENQFSESSSTSSKVKISDSEIRNKMNKKIKSEKQLSKHERESSSTKVKIRDLEMRNKMNNKIKSENKLSKYECEVCSKIFETAKKLFLHSRVHNKSIACPLDACGKVFATKGDLEKHIRTHTGEKPYACDICDKSFTQQVTLRLHKETVHHSFKS